MNKLTVKSSLLFVTAITLLSACGQSNQSNQATSEESAEVQSSEVTSIAPESAGVNERGYSLEIPEGLPDNWDFLKIGYKGQVYDWINKPAKDIDESWHRFYDVESTVLEPGQAKIMEISQQPGEDAELSIGLFSIVILNDTVKPIEMAEGRVIGVNAFSSYFLDYQGELSYTGPGKFVNHSFVLPKGLVAYDKLAKAIELYDEGQIVDDNYEVIHEYTKDDKKMTLYSDGDEIIEFKLRGNTVPKFHTDAIEKSKDYSKEVTPDAFINLGGYKLHLNTPLKDLWEGLQLGNIFDKEISPEFYNEQENLTIEPGAEKNYLAAAAGYPNTEIKLRLYNPSSTTIKAMDAMVVGVQINYTDYIPPINEDTKNWNMPVTAPLGIVMGNKFEDEFKKIPDDAEEKLFPDKDSAYATMNDGIINYHVIASPTTVEYNHEVNSIMFTLLNF